MAGLKFLTFLIHIKGLLFNKAGDVMGEEREENDSKYQKTIKESST